MSKSLILCDIDSDDGPDSGSSGASSPSYRIQTIQLFLSFPTSIVSLVRASFDTILFFTGAGKGASSGRTPHKGSKEAKTSVKAAIRSVWLNMCERAK